MYTSGIRKIYEAKRVLTFKEAVEEARKAEYELLLWNGNIFLVSLNNMPIDTSLHIDDFKVTLS